MNIRNGLKTLAVALPLSVAPVKSTAQNIVKEASKPVVTARVGAGGQVSSYYGLLKAEYQMTGKVGVRSKRFVADLDGAAGLRSQDVKLNVGVPVVSGKAGHIDAGAVSRYQHNAKSGIDGVILENEVNSGGNSVGLYRDKAFVGAYVAPTLKVGQVDITAHAEAGLAKMTGKTNVARADVPAIIYDERMVNNSRSEFGSNLGLSVDAYLDSGVRAGLDYEHSTVDHSNKFMAKISYEIDRLFHHKKK